MLNGTCYEIVREILPNKNLNIAEYVVMEEIQLDTSQIKYQIMSSLEFLYSD